MAAAAGEEQAGLQASSITARKGPFAGTKGFIGPVKTKTSLHVPDYLLPTCWFCPVPASQLCPRRAWNVEQRNGELGKH